MKPRILAFSGSSRKDSLNKKILQVAVEGAIASGAEVTLLDLAEFPLPLYDGDLEASSGLPNNVTHLKSLFLKHEGLLIATPEYNSSVTPLLKNTIDWMSRPAPGEVTLGCFVGKVAALISASPGSLGGVRGLSQLRTILSNIQVMVAPNSVAVPKADEAFDLSGKLRDEKINQALRSSGGALSELLSKLAGRNSFGMQSA